MPWLSSNFYMPGPDEENVAYLPTSSTDAEPGLQLAYTDPNTNAVTAMNYGENGTVTSPLASSEARNNSEILGLGLSPNEAQSLYELKTSNPNEYYSQLAQNLANKINNNFQQNLDSSTLENSFNNLEKIAPQAYYPAKISSLAHEIAWMDAQGNPNKNLQQEIQALAPKAVAYGLDPNSLQNAYQTGYTTGYTGSKQRMSNIASSGNFWHDNLIGALKVGSLALGAYGLDSALTAGMTGMVDAAGNIIGGGAEGAAYGGSGLGINAPLQGPTYGELGITGVPEGGMGPTYAEMGYTGLNQADAIAAADAASKGLTGADALKYINQAKQTLNNGSQLAKLLGGTTGGTSVGTSAGTSGMNPQQLASLLGGGQQTNSFIGQIKANQNPFTFTSAGQTAATPGMYDVSGSNLANALRKA